MVIIMERALLLFISASITDVFSGKPQLLLLGIRANESAPILQVVTDVLKTFNNARDTNPALHFNESVFSLPWPSPSEPYKIISLGKRSSEDVVMIIARPDQCQQRTDLLAISSHLTLPVVLLPSPACREEPRSISPNVFYLGVPLYPLLSFLLDHMESKGYDSFVIILDEITETMLGNALQDIIFSTNIVLYSAEELADSKSELYRDILEHRDQYSIFIAAVTSMNYKVFDEAHGLEILSPVQSWVVINVDSSLSDLMTCFHQTDVVVIIDARTNFQKMKSCDRNSPFLQTSNISEQYRFLSDMCHVSSFILSHISPGTFPMKVPEIMRQLRSMVYLRLWSSHMHTETLTFAGHINPYYSVSIPITLVQPFSGFHGKMFNITTLENKLFQIKRPDGTFEGVAFDILHELQKTLNFSYTIFFPPDKQWGARQKNGSWSGMIGLVSRREIDFAVGSFTVTSAREEVIDYTFPYWQASAGMIMRTSSTSSDKLMVYLRPFKMAVWLCLFASIPLGASALWIMSTMSHEKAIEKKKASNPLDSYQKSNPQKKENIFLNGAVHHTDSNITNTHFSPNKEPNFFVCILMVFGLQWQQSLPWLPRVGAARWMVGALWIVAVVMAATYTGNLIAFLAVPKVTVPVDSLQDLADETEYSVGLVRGQAVGDIFKNSPPHSLYNRIWKKIALSDDNIVNNLSQGYRRVVEEDFIYLDDTKNLAAIQIEEAQRGNCSLYIAKQKFYASGYALPLQPKSPYLYIFNERILAMLGSGVIDKWMRKYKPSIEDKCGVAGPGVDPISLEDTKSLFYLLIMGTMAATLALLFENMFSKT